MIGMKKKGMPPRSGKSRVQREKGQETMKWEFLGVQELREGMNGKGYVYTVGMWRTPAPGGWLLMSINTKSNNPQPTQSFYPDPDHLWTGKTPPEAAYLLRAAGADSAPSTQSLLRASDDPNIEPKRIES